MSEFICKTNISIIGMPACGKSTLGVLLAKTLNMMFIDTDLIIQQKNGKLLSQIIESSGIDEFKRKESDVICSLACENTCIATGGSAVYSEKAMNHLKQCSTIIFLDVSCAEVEKRIADIKSRGVVIEDGKTLFELFNERRPLYLQYADIIIKADNLSVEDLLVQIVSQIHRA